MRLPADLISAIFNIDSANNGRWRWPSLPVSAAVHDRGSVVGLWRLTDALMACSSSATPGTVGGAGRFGLAGLVAAFGWGVWIVSSSVVLLGV